jgi:xylulokinase
MLHILAHDLGTTGNKATLFDEDGRLVASTFVAYKTSFPHQGWAEQNPNEWWRSLCESTRLLLHQSGVSAGDVAGVAFSGQMMGAAPVDKNVVPLRDAIIWADLRASAQIERVAERLSPEEVYATTGHRLGSSYSAAKMAWIKEMEPQTYGSTHKFLQPKDFVAAKLTGIFATDPSDASGTNLYDLAKGTWSDRMVEGFEIDQEKLPDILPSTCVVGEVRVAAAEETGLRAGTRVVIGGGDGCCAAAGAGVVREGVAYNVIGSSSWIALASTQPLLDPDMRTFTWAHVVPGMFSPCGTMQAAGTSYQWARDQLAQSERSVAENLGLPAYEVMNQEVLQSPPGARGLLYLPYLMGERSPRWNPKARGAFIGLTVRHRHVDLLRAVLEGITFNLRVILEAFLNQGAQIPALRLIGGGARSAVWNQIMADIFGIPVQRLSVSDEATSMGAALSGGVGIGLWKDFSQVDQMIEVLSETKPREAWRQPYDELYEAFNEAYTCLDKSSVFSRLTHLDQD